MSEQENNGQVQELENEDATQELDATASAEKDEVTAQEASADVSQERQAREQELLGELEQTRDQLLRQAAEYQNYRRRTEQERLMLQQRGQTQVILPMLDVLDDFGRSLEASERLEEQEDAGAAYQALKAGVELVYQKFADELRKLGVEPIEAVGQPFDEHLHEAMMQKPADDDTPSGTVLEELQRGYRLGDRVVRHSKVVVAS